MCVIETITYIYPDDSRHRQPYHRLCQQSVDGQPCARAEYRNLGERRLNDSPPSRPPARPDMPPQGLYSATHPSNALQPPDLSPSTVLHVPQPSERGKKTLVIGGGRFELSFRSRKEKKEKRKSEDSATDASDFQPIVLPQAFPEAPEPPPAVPGYIRRYGESQYDELQSPRYYDPSHSPVTQEYSSSPPTLLSQIHTSPSYAFPAPTYEERIPPSRRHSHSHRHRNPNVIHQTSSPTPRHNPSRSLSIRRLTTDHQCRILTPQTRHSAPARSPLPPPPLPSPPPPPPPIHPHPDNELESDNEYLSRQSHRSTQRRLRRETWLRDANPLPSQDDQDEDEDEVDLDLDLDLEDELEHDHDLSRAHHRSAARRQRRDQEREELQARVERLEREVQRFRAEAEERLVGGGEDGRPRRGGGGGAEERERRPRFEEVRIEGGRSIRVDRPREREGMRGVGGLVVVGGRDGDDDEGEDGGVGGGEGRSGRRRRRPWSWEARRFGG